jgi:hypothetical protein
MIDKFLNRVNKTDSCWLWMGRLDKHGYGESKLIGRMAPHRISYTLFKGEIPKGIFVCHTCDIRHCVNPDHLWIGTNSENMKDMALKGRIHSKLTPENVREIRDVYENKWYFGVSRDLAKKFNVHNSTICKIVKMKKRQHV